MSMLSMMRSLADQIREPPLEGGLQLLLLLRDPLRAEVVEPYRRGKRRGQLKLAVGCEGFDGYFLTLASDGKGFLGGGYLQLAAFGAVFCEFCEGEELRRGQAGELALRELGVPDEHGEEFDHYIQLWWARPSVINMTNRWALKSMQMKGMIRSIHPLLPQFYFPFYIYLPSQPNTMFRNSHNTFFESHESTPTGCCASTFLPCRPALHLQNPSRIRVYSQPRESSGRKIEVVSARKGHSHAKETTPTNRSLNREPPALGPKVQKKIMASPRVTSNSRSQVQMAMKQEEKAQNGGLKISRVTQTRPSPRKETDPNSTNLPSFQYISQISLISEEFVSQGSAINIVNLIAPPKNVAPSRIPTQLYQPPKNPIQRLMDRKRYQLRAENRKKKIIT